MLDTNTIRTVDQLLGMLRGLFGRYVNRSLGYSLRVTYRNYPGMNARYVEGPRTMNVFGEVMANGKDWHLDSRGIPEHWEAPYDSELVDEARRRLVLDRIVTALSHMGHRVWLWDQRTQSWEPPT